MAEFQGRARFVSENYGDSELAKRFGVTRYPAIFVGDVLVATPNDFGFYGKGEDESKNGGRYAPLKSAKAHGRFRDDLRRMIELLLAGKSDAARALAVSPEDDGAIAEWPAGVTITDLDGKTIENANVVGRAVLVDFWATWCPPCLGSLPWVADLSKRYGDKFMVVAIAVESPEEKVREIAREKNAPAVRWVQGTPDLVRSFGDVSAVPTLLLFDREGRLAASYFGAPPGQHAEVEAKLESILR